mmetsp:Transcript_135097/g.431705  ORF Transcript_135097/g.431705 Transcript_135097/m.431705 type:complete len:248 (+) Transcript_135097:3952-4695(+)
MLRLPGHQPVVDLGSQAQELRLVIQNVLRPFDDRLKASALEGAALLALHHHALHKLVSQLLTHNQLTCKGCGANFLARRCVRHQRLQDPLDHAMVSSSPNIRDLTSYQEVQEKTRIRANLLQLDLHRLRLDYLVAASPQQGPALLLERGLPATGPGRGARHWRHGRRGLSPESGFANRLGVVVTAVLRRARHAGLQTLAPGPGVVIVVVGMNCDAIEGVGLREGHHAGVYGHAWGRRLPQSTAGLSP